LRGADGIVEMDDNFARRLFNGVDLGSEANLINQAGGKGFRQRVCPINDIDQVAKDIIIIVREPFQE
jgi:hypothetical protein